MDEVTNLYYVTKAKANIYHNMARSYDWKNSLVGLGQYMLSAGTVGIVGGALGGFGLAGHVALGLTVGTQTLNALFVGLQSKFNWAVRKDTYERAGDDFDELHGRVALLRFKLGRREITEEQLGPAFEELVKAQMDLERLYDEAPTMAVSQELKTLRTNPLLNV